jgi:hypothetical protein
MFPQQTEAVETSTIQLERVTLNMCEGTNPLTVTKLSLKLAQNEQIQSKSREQKLALSDGWQRDLVEFSIR